VEPGVIRVHRRIGRSEIVIARHRPGFSLRTA
jgi:hypothetical protein